MSGKGRDWNSAHGQREDRRICAANLAEARSGALWHIRAGAYTNKVTNSLQDKLQSTPAICHERLCQTTRPVSFPPVPNVILSDSLSIYACRLDVHPDLVH